MRRLLMIAYHFPPSLSVGRIRTIKFSKYLPQFGWQPVVLTCQPPPGMPCDPHHEIPPGTEVHRIGRDNFHPWLRAGAETARAIIGRIVRSLRPTRSDRPSRQTPGALGLGRGSALSLLLRTLTYWPDEQCTWIPAASRKALSLVRSCDAIYSSGNPWSDHAVASRVRKFTSLPWIMDFRDPWMLGGVYSYPFSLQRRILQNVEKRWVSQCDFVLQVTPPLTETYRSAYSFQPATKFVTLPNGFDPDDFEGLPSPEPEFPMTMTHLGSLLADRDAAALIQGLALLKQQGQVKAGELRVRLIGSGAQKYADAAEQASVSDLFDLVPPVPRRMALEALARSHVALMIGGPRFGQKSMPTKLYEYLAMRKYILAIVPKGVMRSRLEPLGVACVDCRDVEGIARIILNALTEFRQRKSLESSKELPDLYQYHREYLTKRLVKLLDEIVTAGPNG